MYICSVGVGRCGAVVMVVGGRAGLGGRWVDGDGTNQGQGGNHLLPREIIGGAGYQQYFSPVASVFGVLRK